MPGSPSTPAEDHEKGVDPRRWKSLAWRYVPEYPNPPQL
jgi:hypothetical protein